MPVGMVLGTIEAGDILRDSPAFFAPQIPGLLPSHGADGPPSR